MADISLCAQEDCTIAPVRRRATTVPGGQDNQSWLTPRETGSGCEFLILEEGLDLGGIIARLCVTMPPVESEACDG